MSTSTPSSVTSSPSAGCGKPTSQALAQYVTDSVHVTGATLDPTYQAPAHDRAFAVWLPHDYDPTVPWPTVFIASACGSVATTETRYMSSAGGDPEAIYVGLASPPPDLVPSGCFDDSGAKSIEWEYFALVATQIEQRFCVDQHREIVAGLRGGGALANMLGCYFSKPDPSRAFASALALRAQFSIASGLPVGLPACGGAIAGFSMHDMNEFNPVTDSSSSRDRVLGLDGCATSPTEDWGTGVLAGLGCKKYVGCPAADPVVFCETTGRGRQANYYDITAPALTQFLGELGF